MPEIKIYRDTRVMLALTEREAAVLNTVLSFGVDLSTSPELAGIVDALDGAEISDLAVALRFNEATLLIEAD